MKKRFKWLALILFLILVLFWIVSMYYYFDKGQPEVSAPYLFISSALLLTIIVPFILYQLFAIFLLLITRRYGTRAVATITRVTIDEGFYFEHNGIWSNRLDVELIVKKDVVKPFKTKARGYIVYFETDSFSKGSEMIIRYFPLFKNRVYFDREHIGKSRQKVVTQYRNKQKSSRQTTMQYAVKSFVTSNQ